MSVLYISVDSGLLIHCISGWDRTPLFISLLRMSLWADGAVHASLSAQEMLYLVIAYDWFLFGYVIYLNLLVPFIYETKHNYMYNSI